MFYKEFYVCYRYINPERLTMLKLIFKSLVALRYKTSAVFRNLDRTLDASIAKNKPVPTFEQKYGLTPKTPIIVGKCKGHINKFKANRKAKADLNESLKRIEAINANIKSVNNR